MDELEEIIMDYFPVKAKKIDDDEYVSLPLEELRDMLKKAHNMGVEKSAENAKVEFIGDGDYSAMNDSKYIQTCAAGKYLCDKDSILTLKI